MGQLGDVWEQVEKEQQTKVTEAVLETNATEGVSETKVVETLVPHTEDEKPKQETQEGV